MASTTLDVRADAARPLPPVAGAARALPPAAVLAAAGVSLLDAVAVVAAALTGLDGLFSSPDRPSSAVAALWLLVLAAWAVLGAGGGLLLSDGSGSRLLTVVACAEVAVLAVVFLLGLATTAFDGSAAGLPVPALALAGLAVPVGKLLLATAPSSTAWTDAGPRPRAPRPELSEDQQALRIATLTVIGLALLSVVLLNPVDSGPDGATGTPAPASTTQH